MDPAALPSISLTNTILPRIARKKYPRIKAISASCLVLLVTLGLAAPLDAQTEQLEKKILVLFDGGIMSPWRRGFTSGFQNEIYAGENPQPQIQIAFDAQGLSSFPQGERPDLVIDMLKHKNAIVPADLVITILPLVADFMLRYHSEIYPETPIIYLLPGDELAERIGADGSPVANLMMGEGDSAMVSTFNLIIDLLPDLKQINVVSGSDILDLEGLKFIKDHVAQVAPAVSMEYLTGIPRENLPALLEAMPADSAVLMLSFEEDYSGAPTRTNEVLDIVIENSPVPIFVPFDFTFVEGVVGGNFNSSAMIGRNVAQMAISVFQESTNVFFPATPTVYNFNQTALDRWNISSSLLPSGSIIINEELSVLQQYSRELLLFLALFCLLLVIVFSFRKKARDADTQKVFFESVINSIPDAILITDTAANIFATNKGAGEVFSLDQNNLLGRDIRSLMGDSDSDKKPDKLEVRGIEENLEPQVFTYKKHSGETFSGETIATKITTETGDTLGHFSLIRDISKRLSMEEEQRQGQKMEALGNLVGGISHDFNNVLGVISGYAELSLLEGSKKSPKVHLEKILQATQRAKALVSQIMTFSRDTSSQQQPIDLAELLRETMKLIKVSIPSSIETSMEIDEDVMPVLGTAVQIQEIIMNLTTNAYQAMVDDGGSIHTTLRSQQVEGEQNLSHGVLSAGKYTVLSVSDTGPGMEDGVSNRVFEPFFTTKSQGKGSGMGMTIVYNLAKAHGATVDLKSATGQGTSVSLYFKAVAEGINAISMTEQDIKIYRGRGETILLVDDEEDLLDSANKLLTGIGYSVYAFSDPTEALEGFKNQPEKFDILLSDESMPKLTGVQLVKEVRSLRPELPAVICTGYSEVLNQTDIEEFKLSGVIRKPFTLEEISRVISTALALHLEIGDK